MKEPVPVAHLKQREPRKSEAGKAQLPRFPQVDEKIELRFENIGSKQIHSLSQICLHQRSKIGFVTP